MKPITVTANLEDLMPQIRTGDLISTAHRSTFGRIIHLGQGFRRPWHSMIALVQNGQVDICESTASEAGGKGKRGAQRHPLTQRVEETDGEVWVSRLSSDMRKLLDERRIAEWLIEKVNGGSDYSYGQAFFAGIDGLLKIIPENTWSKTYMCSRFYTGAVRNGFGDSELGLKMIAREASPTPAQLVRLPGFFSRHYQIKGSKLYEIGG